MISMNKLLLLLLLISCILGGSTSPGRGSQAKLNVINCNLGSSQLARISLAEFIQLITYPLGGGYVLFYTLFLTALSLSLSLSVISYLLFGITRPLLERE